MKYNRFEDVPAWKAGIELTVQVFKITGDPAFRFKGDIASQIQRAALSVPNNIAEGFERGTTPDLITFLYYAKGSAGEVRSICHVLDRMPEFEHLKPQVAGIRDVAASVSRQLSAWTASLQDSDITGARHLTQKSRQIYQQKKETDAFTEHLKRMQEENLRRILAEREQKQKEDGEG